MGAMAGGESGRLDGCDGAGLAKVGQEHRGDANYDGHVAKDLLGRRIRDDVEMGVVGVPVIVGGDRVGDIAVAAAAVMVVGHMSRPVLGRVPMGEAMTHLGEEEGRGHDRGQQEPGKARQVRRHGLQDNAGRRRGNGRTARRRAR